MKKTDFDAKLKKNSDSVASNKTKHLLVENEFKKLKTFDSSYFKGKSHFEEDVISVHTFMQVCMNVLKKRLWHRCFPGILQNF